MGDPAAFFRRKTRPASCRRGCAGMTASPNCAAGKASPRACTTPGRRSSRRRETRVGRRHRACRHHRRGRGSAPRGECAQGMHSRPDARGHHRHAGSGARGLRAVWELVTVTGTAIKKIAPSLYRYYRHHLLCRRHNKAETSPRNCHLIDSGRGYFISSRV